MKVLVTGAAGFIGSHLVERLIGEGHDVFGLDVINEYYDIRIKYGRLDKAGIRQEKIAYNEVVASDRYSNYRFTKMALEDEANVMTLFQDEKFEMVCNLAAQAGVRYSLLNPGAYISSNICGFMNVLEGCRHNDVKHLVYASSSSVYGLNEKIPFSTSHNVDHPMSLYAATKKSNELMAHSYSHLFALPTTGLRFFTVYGPWGRPDMALFLFTKAIMENRTIDVFNYGNMKRDFTYIDDIIEGIMRVLGHPARSNTDWSATEPEAGSSSAPYRIYNIGNNSPVKLLDFIEAIEGAVGKKGKKNLLPMQPGDVPVSNADVADLIADLAYSPRTSVQEGIGKFVSWYKDFYSGNECVLAVKELVVLPDV